MWMFCKCCMCYAGLGMTMLVEVELGSWVMWK